MILYPKLYCKKVTDITIEFLKENKIKGIILDVDNTLIDFDRNLLDGVVEWKNKINEIGIDFVILSNSNKKEKLTNVANALGISYIGLATKPLKRGFKKAQEKLNLPSENIAVVGDQIFTDVLGANRCKMVSVLVMPIAEKDYLITKIKRPLENFVIKKYLKKKG